MSAGRPPLAGTFGGVSSTHWLATGSGMAVLDRGGNAFDAVVTAGLTLQVVEPHSCGPGGDVTVLLHEHGSGRVQVVCGQGPVPSATSIKAFSALGLDHIPAAGLLPATVPGAFGAWLRVLAEFGTIELEEALGPAIGYAAGGFPVLSATARTIAAVAPVFRSDWAGSAATWLPRGQVPTPGSRLTNPVLAETLRRIVREASGATTREARIALAHDAFYSGFVAEAIDRFVRAPAFDSTGRRHRGWLRADDLDGWTVPVEESCSSTYRGVSVHKAGPWTQGPVFLQQLGILEGFDPGALVPGSAEYVHTLVEAAKLALADREAWYGDAAHVPMDELLSPEYSARRRALIGARSASDPAPGHPGGLQSWLPDVVPEPIPPGEPEWMAHLRSGIPTPVPANGRVGGGAGNTAVVAAVDRHGNLAVAVPSGGWLKSSPLIPSHGFAHGTRAQTAWLVEDHPNSLVPGRRPRTTLSPTIALLDDRPYLAFGTPGGDQQDQWTLQAFLAVVDGGLDLTTATELPAFHSDHFPQSFAPRTARPQTVVVENSLGEPVLKDLQARGHRLDVVPPSTLGKVCVVALDPRHGFLGAAAGPRGQQAYAACR